jgi:hypothetical protein
MVVISSLGLAAGQDHSRAMDRHMRQSRRVRTEKEKVGQRTLERYEELLRLHVKPKLGARPLQKPQATEIDQLYGELEALVDEDGDRKIAPMTLHHVHVTFYSCLSIGICRNRRPGRWFPGALKWIGSKLGPRSHCVRPIATLSD